MRKLPSILQQHIDAALATLTESLNGDLELAHRLPIYGFFDTLAGLQGRSARTYAAIIVARRVLPVWDVMPQEASYSTMPRLMLSTAELWLSHIQRGWTAEQLNTLADDTVVEVILGTASEPLERYNFTINDLAGLAAEMHSLTGELPTSLYYHAWCAFLTAMEALREALGWPWWNKDAAEWAAIAYAGGDWSEDEGGDPDEFAPQGTWNYLTPEVQTKRREFWEWWCRELIPATWREVS